MSAVWTVGHSNRSFEDFLDLLRAHGVERVVDVRRFPASRANPQFNKAALARRLPPRGLRYLHLEALGGRRKSRKDSPNAGWRNASFRGYADYMGTSEFRKALAALRALARRERTALLCAEALPWRCHRSLIADALTAWGFDVAHLMSVSSARPHRRPPFARLRGRTLTYPPHPRTVSRISG